MGFLDKLSASIARRRSMLCVGLDPTLDGLPEGIVRSPEGMLAFNRAIVEATHDLVCAYKPNLAFYEALGTEGWRVLAETIRLVPDGIPVIADAKRGDTSSTAAAYASAIFDVLGADACTVNPYLGSDGILPFVDRPGRFAFVLCRTSNPSAGELQDLEADGLPLYLHIARRAATEAGGWGGPTRCGLVVGTTDPFAAGRVVDLAPDSWLLAPGLGAQGGDVVATAAALGPAVVRTLWSASRSITGAGRGRDFATQARAAAERLRDEINRATVAGGAS